MPTRQLDIWPWNWKSYLIETFSIAVIIFLSMVLQYGQFTFGLLMSPQLWIRIIGSLFLWFANRFALDYVLQSRINTNRVTQFLPFELTIASITVTSIGYGIFYPIVIFLSQYDFELSKFLQGLFLTCGLSLMIVIFYAGSHLWNSWWSDGEFLFRPPANLPGEGSPDDSIVIKHAKGTTKHNLKEVLYFISESKIAFLVDHTGKKWITQYTLSELEDLLGSRFFRLNRQILVSRQAISDIKRLPNHRLMVTVGSKERPHQESISRYRSTRFKQWYQSASDHSAAIQ